MTANDRPAGRDNSGPPADPTDDVQATPAMARTGTERSVPPSRLPPDRTNPSSDARPPTPVLVRREQAAALCGMGLSTFDRADATGLIPLGRRVGGCKLWSVAELAAWADHGCPQRTAWQVTWAAVLASRRTRSS